MFKFDFKVDEIETGNEFLKEQGEPKRKSEEALTMDWYDSEEVLPKEDVLESLDIYKLNSTELVAGNLTLTCLVSGFLLQDITNDDTTKDLTAAEQSHSDLIPGVYEGGAKIWECTEDLIKYMVDHYQSDMWQGKRVLDLGCGSGVLGIFAYKSGAKVQFQDYNKDVLEKITIPNVILNVPKPPIETDLSLKKLRTDVQFYSGDWSKYVAFSEQNDKFDVILTCETIYNPQNQQKLLDALDAKLKTDGIVLVAAKTYYFGVGGGLRQFEELIVKDGRFGTTILWSSVDGVSREILELKRI